MHLTKGTPQGRTRPFSTPQMSGGRGGRRALELWRLLLALLMVLCSALHLGWTEPVASLTVLRLTQVGLLVAYGVLLLVQHAPRGRRADGVWFKDQFSRPDRLVATAGIVMAWWWPALDVAGALLLLTHFWGFYLWLLQRGVNPGLIFAGSFAGLIAIGSVLLLLPASTPRDRPISVIDAVFTATSASCVTGLAVRDTGTEFTRFGQSVIMVLIQLGGLGTVLFGALVAMLLGSSMSLKAVQALADTSSGAKVSEASIRKLVLFAALVVFGCELIGAGMLYFGWPDTWDRAPADIQTFGGRLFHSVFFSVSSFCNAGFATTPNSVESLRIHWTTHVVIAGLAFIGGLGLPVYTNLAQIVRARLSGRHIVGGMLVRLSFHTRLVLIVMAVTYLAGALMIFFSQWLQRDVPVGTALLDAHFMSIATRTSGFDSTTPAGMGPLSRFALMLTMFIGGAPASAAGGIKVIVFAIMFLMAWSAIINRDGVQALGRTIPPEVQRRAAALFMLHLLLVLSVAGVLVFTEHGTLPVDPESDIGVFEQMVFESISACSTVGLSLNTTPNLSVAGKWAVIAGMFLGRVGSLAFLVALVGAVKKDRARYQYPNEGVVLS